MSILLAFRPRQDSLPPDEGSWHGGVKSFELHVVNADDEVREAAALRHRAYTAMGYAIADSNGEFTDRFDARSTTVVLNAYDHGRLVGTMRLSFSHPWQSISTLPCASHYPALKDVKREQSGGLIEISRMAIEPHISNTSYRTTLYAFMVRAAFTAAQAASVSMILLATKPDRPGFISICWASSPSVCRRLIRPLSSRLRFSAVASNRPGVASDCGTNSSKLPTKKSQT